VGVKRHPFHRDTSGGLNITVIILEGPDIYWPKVGQKVHIMDPDTDRTILALCRRPDGQISRVKTESPSSKQGLCYAADYEITKIDPVDTRQWGNVAEVTMDRV